MHIAHLSLRVSSSHLRGGLRGWPVWLQWGGCQSLLTAWAWEHFVSQKKGCAQPVHQLNGAGTHVNQGAEILFCLSSCSMSTSKAFFSCWINATTGVWQQQQPINGRVLCNMICLYARSNAVKSFRSNQARKYSVNFYVCLRWISWFSSIEHWCYLREIRHCAWKPWIFRGLSSLTIFSPAIQKYTISAD